MRSRRSSGWDACSGDVGSVGRKLADENVAAVLLAHEIRLDDRRGLLDEQWHAVGLGDDLVEYSKQ